MFAGPLDKLDRCQTKIECIKNEKIRKMMSKGGIWNRDPKRMYIKYLGVIKQTMTMIKMGITFKMLRIKKRNKKRKVKLKDKKKKLKKILKVNLRISSYMNKLKEQFMVDI